MKFSYNAEVYDTKDILRVQGHVNEVIKCVLSDPDRLITSINLVPFEEEKQIHAFHGKQRFYPTKRFMNCLKSKRPNYRNKRR